MVYSQENKGKSKIIQALLRFVFQKIFYRHKHVSFDWK